MRVLITGGAGFIGSHLADRLLASGYDVRILDSLVPQVHQGGAKPSYLTEEAELIQGDVRDRETLQRTLAGVDAVCHLAARVGVGQSMYEIADYTSANNLGTAMLLQCLIERPVQRLVVASSMSVYGEGSYTTVDGAPAVAARRSLERIRRGQWEPLSADGQTLIAIPTAETKTPDLASVYALSKFDQERLSLIVGAAYSIPTIALRFFNVYGTRQALSNPYTGVLAIFASRLLNGRPPLIFEDGAQRRDFVSVHDVAVACQLALERPATAVAGQAFNIGSGEAFTVTQVARMLAAQLGVDIEPETTSRYRVGDVRHCFAELSLAERGLAYRPTRSFRQGLAELTDWLEQQHAEDHVADASHELERRGLTV
ncbi:MAG: SDR family NAD(P)-dependent oxidoreductase [Acidobacteria bacterium]|nr:SDR family NAD(P)-dependent oxidoreductase [Acidobacteriota bacterium]